MEAKARLSPKSFVGMTEIAALIKAKLNGIKFFVAHRDGQSFLRTQNVDENRINVNVKEGIITEAYYG